MGARLHMAIPEPIFSGLGSLPLALSISSGNKEQSWASCATVLLPCPLARGSGTLGCVWEEVGEPGRCCSALPAWVPRWEDGVLGPGESAA